jgi:hypothetical protein
MSEVMKPMITVEDTGKEFKINVELEGLQLENDTLQKSLEMKAKEMMDFYEKMVLIAPPKKWAGLSVNREAVKAKLVEAANATEQLLVEKKEEIRDRAKSMNVDIATLEFGTVLREKVTAQLNKKIGETVAVAKGRSTEDALTPQQRQLRELGIDESYETHRKMGDSGPTQGSVLAGPQEVK